MKLGKLLGNITSELGEEISEKTLKRFLKSSGSSFGKFSDDGAEFILNKGVKSKHVANAFGDSNIFRRSLEIPDKRTLAAPSHIKGKTLSTNNKSLENQILKQRNNFDEAEKALKLEYEKSIVAPRGRNEARDEVIKEFRKIKNLEADEAIANQYANMNESSAFASYKYDEYAKRNKVDEASFAQKQRKEELKSKISEDRQKHYKDLKQKNSSAKNDDPKGNGNNFVYKMAAAGVGGGLVLSMSNKKGQQSNSQLYGQGGF